MIVIDTVNEQMYELIRNMILDHDLKPGERINLKQIAQDNNVSLMPIRNALQRLSAQGLVETRQRVGVFVRHYSNAELWKMGELRKLYELYSLQEYASNIDKSELMELYQQIDQMDAVGRAALLLDERLHSLIVEASHNEFLIHQYQEMLNLFRIHMYSESDTAELSKREHLSLISAIYKGNYKSAYAILERHLNRVVETYEE